ncbi:hypothetical protein VE26_16850, partial [Devosia chinhatensis]
CTGRPTGPTAVAHWKRRAHYDLNWIEDTTPPESIDDPADVRAHSPIPSAAGERFYEPPRFLEALAKKAVDILQPDVSHAAGMGDVGLENVDSLLGERLEEPRELVEALACCDGDGAIGAHIGEGVDAFRRRGFLDLGQVIGRQSLA